MSIPENYWLDSQGRYIPPELVKDIDKERDALVREVHKEALELRDALARFKARAMGDVQAFVELSAEKYGVKLGGRKGNTTLTCFDGSLKIQVALQETLVFDEKIQAAKALIDECLTDWSLESHPGLVSIIQDAFQVNQAGHINTRRILTLRNQNIDDPRWQRAMQAIADSLKVSGSKYYIRIYERDQSGAYQAVSLDIAAI